MWKRQSGQLLLDTSTGSSLTGLGNVNSGSIVEGFGPITLRHPSALQTTCQSGISTAGCGPTTTLKGDLHMDSARVIFSDQDVVASASIVLNGYYTVYRVTSGNSNAANGLTLPSSSPDPEPGQMLVVENADDRNLVIGGDLQDIHPGMVCTYFYIGAKWVETARNCYLEGGNSYACPTS